MNRVHLAVAFLLVIWSPTAIADCLLPAEADLIDASGIGESIVCRHDSLRVLSIVDTATQSIRGYIPTNGDATLLAVGRNYLVLIDRGTETVSRWSLNPIAVVQTASITGAKEWIEAAAGCNSDELVYVWRKPTAPFTGLLVVDSQTLQTRELSLEPPCQPLNPAHDDGTSLPDESVGLLAADDGMSILVQRRKMVLRRSGDTLKRFDVFGQALHGLSSDGAFVYDSDNARLVDEPNRTHGFGHTRQISNALVGRGSPFVALTYDEPFNHQKQRMTDVGIVAPFIANQLLTSAKLPMLSLREQFSNRRFQLLANMNCLVGVRHGSDTLEFYPVDCDAAYQSLDPFMRVPRAATLHATPGGTLQHKIESFTNQRDIRYAIPYGPDGMNVSNDGTVTWQPPIEVAGQDLLAVVQVSDQDQLLVTQTIRVNVAALPLTSPKAPNEPSTVKFGEIVTSGLLPKLSAIQSASAVRCDIPMPGRVTNASVCGSGRWMVLSFAENGKIAVIDLHDGRYLSQLSLPGKWHVTAGSESLYVLQTETNMISRWSLPDLQFVKSAIIETLHDTDRIWMGSASNSPLCLGVKHLATRGGGFYLRSLDPVSLTVTQQFVYWNSSEDPIQDISANGQTLVTWGRNSPSGLQTYVMTQDVWVGYTAHGDGEGSRPNFDGGLIGTTAGAISTRFEPHAELGDRRMHSIPSYDGPLGLLVVPPARSARSRVEKPQVKLIAFRELTHIADITDLGLTGKLWLFAKQSLIVELSEDGSTISFHRYGSNTKLQRAIEQCFYVTSSPPRFAEPDQTWEYHIQVNAPSPPVKFEKIEGPDEMQVDDSGYIRWPVAASESRKTVQATIELSDQEGRFLTHRLMIELPSLIANHYREKLQGSP